MSLFILFICGILLKANLAWPSTNDTLLTVDKKSIAGAPAHPTPQEENGIWNVPRGLGWDHRFFDKPPAQYIASKDDIRIPNNSSFSVTSPGGFPGIEFGVDMNSFQALQQVVPPERFSQSLNSEQIQALLLSPTTYSSDYNGGFLRFTW